MTRKRIIALGAGAAALVGALWILYAWLAQRSSNEYSGTVETREIDVGSKIGGRVTAVNVEEGQAVKAATLLVTFECDELKAQRAQAEAVVEQAQANLERLLRGNRPEEIAQAVAEAKAQGAALEAAENGPREQEIKQAQADYQAASAEAKNAETNFNRVKSLVEKEIVSRQQFDDARDKRDAAAERAEAARQRLALLQAGTRPEDLRAAKEHYQRSQAAAELAKKGFRKEDINAARAKLAEASARVTELDARLREATLTAPADGIVEVVSVRPGDLVPAGRIVVTMLEASQLWVKVYVPETRLGRVQLGQKADVRVDSFPRRAFMGEVKQISSEAEFLPRNVQTKDDREHQVFGVKVYLDNREGILKSGMSATVRLK